MFKSKIQTKNRQVLLSVLEDKKIDLWIKIEDKIHSFVSGNKFRKLKYNLEQANVQNKETLLTFRGAFSNHIVATAIAGKLAGFKTFGIIRGDELGVDLNKTLNSVSNVSDIYTKNSPLSIFSKRSLVSF